MKKQARTITPKDLKKLREIKGWNQTEAAEALHVTRAYYNRLEAGERPITPILSDLIECRYGKLLRKQ